MVQGNAILVVDLGNSSTKCKVMFGKDPNTGRFYEQKFEIPNVFAPIDPGYEVSTDYTPEDSTILRVDAELNGQTIRGDFCNGELQRKEKPLSTIKPSASDKKYNLDSTVLSLRMAFLYGFKGVMKLSHTSDPSKLDITWTVVCLLPPGDVDEGKGPMTELINACTKVQSVFPEFDFDVKIMKTAILPEGFCAYAGVVFEAGRKYRPDYKFLIDENVLVVDIGAGTSDMVLIKGNKMVQNSKYTINQGGNNVHQLVRRKLRMKALDIDDDAIRKGIIKGEVKDGAQTVSIVEIVNAAKAEVAQKIVSEIQDFLDATDIKARSVGYVLVCGGGSMQDSEAEDIAPMSKKVIESFQRLSPNSALVEIPERVVSKDKEDGDVEKVTEKISPRDLNLIGASIMAEIL